MRRYLDAHGHLPEQLGYTLYMVSSWKCWVRVLLWPSELVCPTWTVTEQLERQNHLAATPEEKHALFIRIVGVRCARFGDDYAAPVPEVAEWARQWFSKWIFFTRGE